MDAKALVLFIILPLCMLAGLVVLGLKTWRDIQDRQDRHDAQEAQTDSERETPAQRVERIKANLEQRAKRRPFTLISKGENYERRGQWPKAVKAYAESLQLLDQPATLAKIRAVRHIETALQFEAGSKWGDALAAYRLALPDTVNPKFVNARIRYCETVPLYLETCTQAAKLASAGQWEQALTAYDKAKAVAKQAGIKADLRKQIQKAKDGQNAAAKQAKAAERRRQPMNRLTNMLLAQGKHRALLLACAFYASSPDYASFATSIEATRLAAANAVKADQAANPLDFKPRTFDFLKTTNGEIYRGKLVEKKDGICKFHIMRPGLDAVTTIASQKIREIKKKKLSASQLMDEQAEALLASALAALQQHQAIEGAELLGRLCLDYAQAPLLNDVERQKKFFADKAPGLTPLIGDTIECARSAVVPLAEERADFLEHLCPECKGAGQIGCPTCRGTGKAETPCPTCHGAKTVTCPKCGGNGSSTCPKCKGVGYSYRKQKKVGTSGKTLTPYTVRVKTRCKRCGGTGKAKCSKCRGKRVVRCPTCKGKGVTETTCARCMGQKKIICPRCKGLGRLPDEE